MRGARHGAVESPVGLICWWLGSQPTGEWARNLSNPILRKQVGCRMDKNSGSDVAYPSSSAAGKLRATSIRKTAIMYLLGRACVPVCAYTCVCLRVLACVDG
jgi:hypothetical protein